MKKKVFLLAIILLIITSIYLGSKFNSLDRAKNEMISSKIESFIKKSEENCKNRLDLELLKCMKSSLTELINLKLKKPTMLYIEKNILYIELKDNKEINFRWIKPSNLLFFDKEHITTKDFNTEKVYFYGKRPCELASLLNKFNKKDVYWDCFTFYSISVEELKLIIIQLNQSLLLRLGKNPEYFISIKSFNDDGIIWSYPLESELNFMSFSLLRSQVNGLVIKISIPPKN